MDKTGFIQLLDKYLTHSITVEERKQLSQLLKDPSYHTELEAIIDQQLAGNTFEIKEDTELGRLIFEKIQTAKQNSQTPVREMYVPNQVRGKFWRRIAVAASIIITLSFGVFLWFNKPGRQPDLVTQQDVTAPEKSRAVITLADGKKVFLDEAANGSLANENGVNVIKLEEGKIVYDGSQLATQSAQLIYNTLSNPRGSKVIDMTLADGSRVWLNAGSSVTYPVAFIGNERKVSINGEAYFEIAKVSSPKGGGREGASKPFIVSKGDMQITVLGTHFNVNAYDDEIDIKVTLLEGSVKVSSSGQVVTIKPGQQARILSGAEGRNQQPATSNQVDLDQVMAWKNGLFSFSNADIQTVMRQVGRWYNLDISYEGGVPKVAFSGEIDRQLTLNQLFSILSETRINYRIEGNRLIIAP